jgi:intein-encoded DNA endonuclease-like protein
MSKYHKYTTEEKAYIKRLYQEGVIYEEIKKRYAAEFGYDKLSNGVIYRLGRGRNKPKGARCVPPSYSIPKQAYCSYCGAKLKGD